jgi:exopolysaccharide production protein ExoZ
MNQAKLPGLQMARAFAAISIAYFHSRLVTMAFPETALYPIPFMINYGWVAVDFFFAISGYVICMVVTKPKFSRSEFFIRRAFRLYPLWIAASLFFLYLAFHPRGFQPRDTWAFIVYSLTLLPTEHFPFYDLGWSLQHEIAFYALSALIVPVFGLTGLVLFLATGFVAGKIFDLPWYLAQFTFYYPNFITGILAFAVHGYLKKLNAFVLLAVGVGLLWYFTQAFGRVAFPIAMFFLLLGFVSLTFKRNSLIERLGVTLGDASYSIYLLHPLVFWYVFWLLRTWWGPPSPWTAEFYRYSSLIYVCGLSVLSWKYFERWAIGKGEEIIQRRRHSAEATLTTGPQLPQLANSPPDRPTSGS